VIPAGTPRFAESSCFGWTAYGHDRLPGAFLSVRLLGVEVAGHPLDLERPRARGWCRFQPRQPSSLSISYPGPFGIDWRTVHPVAAALSVSSMPGQTGEFD
jgi:hypothetical protein